MSKDEFKNRIDSCVNRIHDSSISLYEVYETLNDLSLRGLSEELKVLVKQLLLIMEGISEVEMTKLITEKPLLKLLDSNYKDDKDGEGS